MDQLSLTRLAEGETSVSVCLAHIYYLPARSKTFFQMCARKIRQLKQSGVVTRQTDTLQGYSRICISNFVALCHVINPG